MENLEKQFNQLKPIGETKNLEPKQDVLAIPESVQKEPKKTGLSLYDVNEVEGGFEVTLPGLLDKKREALIGITTLFFKIREEAEQRARQSKMEQKETFEQMSLEKSYTNFYRIDRQNNKFRVVLPGLVDSETGYYVGTTYKDFDSWEEAKDYFLQERENEEKLTTKPLLEIQTDKNEKIAFSDFDAFRPMVAPAKESDKIPSSIEKYLLDERKLKGTDVSAKTYQETIKETGWEKELYSFINSYLEKEGVEIIKQLEIEHLDSLTPRQAIELATQIVIDLTKYKYSDCEDYKTKADQSTVLELLQEGQKKRHDSGWKGNGICRNFACTIKAVFEALKEKQSKFNRLRNTYCLYESGMAFAPKRGRKNVSDTKAFSHSWNTFVTISKKGAANATIVDVTWAKRNLESKKVEGLDYTLTRMEPVVYAIGRELQESVPDKEEQIKHILSFYMLKIEKLGGTGGWANPEQEKEFYLKRVLELIMDRGIPQELPKTLVEAIGQEYIKIADDADVSEIETIYKISQNNTIDFINIFKNYLKNKQLSDYHCRNLIFKDDSLQRMVFEELKFSNDWDKFLKESSEFRVRMREVLPQLFMGFSPATKPEDMAELKHLIRSQRMLSHYEYMIDPRKPSEEKIKSFFEKARQLLKDVNPQKYDKNIARLDDYKLVKQFDRIERELRA